MLAGRSLKASNACLEILTLPKFLNHTCVAYGEHVRKSWLPTIIASQTQNSSNTEWPSIFGRNIINNYVRYYHVLTPNSEGRFTWDLKS